MIYLLAFLPGWMGLPLFIFSHVSPFCDIVSVNG